MTAFYTEQMTESISLPAAALTPANRTAANYTVGPVDMSKFRRLMAHVNAGVLGGGSVKAFIQESSASNTGFANITSGNTLTISASNTEGTLEVRADQLGSGKRYVQLVLTVVTGPANIAAQLFAGHSTYSPANDNDHSGVANTRLVNGN